METSTAVKVLSGGTAGAGVLGASGYGIHALTSKPKEPETIEEKLKLEREDILPISESDNSRNDDWKKLIEEHKQALENEKMEGLKLDKETDKENIKEIKEQCSLFLRTELGDVGSDERYAKSKRWCVKKKEQ